MSTKAGATAYISLANPNGLATSQLKFGSLTTFTVRPVSAPAALPAASAVTTTEPDGL